MRYLLLLLITLNAHATMTAEEARAKTDKVRKEQFQKVLKMNDKCLTDFYRQMDESIDLSISEGVADTIKDFTCDYSLLRTIAKHYQDLGYGASTELHANGVWYLFVKWDE